MRYISTNSCTKIVGLLLMMSVSFSMAQSFDYKKYNGLYSQGDIPDDMRKTVQELYEEDRGRMEQFTTKRKSRRSEGILECSYAINKMVQGGRILYGDPITQWINRIADTLLKDDPQLRGELRFYTYKSPAVNAFATGQGMIFVSTGLVARLTSEAEMAFILSHEIVHYVNNHTWENISTKAEEGNRRRDIDNIINKHNRSHRMEVEADSLGMLAYYLPSAYYTKVADDVMNILLYSDYAMGNVHFDTTYFDSPYYSLPSEIWLRTIKPIEIDENEVDTNSTHPNIGKRRSLTYRLAANVPEEGEKFLCITDEKFKQIQYLSRMETIRQLAIAGAYVRAFYDSWCLIKQYPDNEFLNRTMAFSLYAMAAYKTKYNNNNMIGTYQDVEGEIQNLYHCFVKMKAPDINILAIRELYNYCQKFGMDVATNNTLTDAVQMLTYKNELKLDTFSREVPKKEEAQAVDTAASQKKLSKYERLKRGGKATAQVVDKRAMAFVDYFEKGNEFETMFNNALADTAKSTTQDKKMLLLSPSYRSYKSNGDIDIKSSDQKENYFIETINEAFEYSDKEAIQYSGHLLKEYTTDTFYNQYMALNEWLREIDLDMPIMLLSQPEAEKVFAAYDVDKVVIMGVQAVAWRGPSGFPIPLPYTLYRRVANRCGTRLATITMDTKGTPSTVYKYESNKKDETALVKQYIYNIVSEAKNPGYLGKHFVISVLADPFINLVESDDDLYGVGLGVGAEYGAKIEFVTGKEMSLITEATTYKLGDINFFNMQLGLRTYISKSFAPFGEYIQIGANAIFSSMERVDNAKLPISGALSANVGRTYIFNDALQLDIYYGLSLPLIKQDGFNIMPHNYLRLGISIGFLPF